jgi:CHAT domain-containing protein
VNSTTLRVLLAIGFAGVTPAAWAQSLAPLAAERFAIGNAGAVCEAQGVRLGEVRGSIYDRKWALICRDVTRPVGAAYSWRGTADAFDRVVRDRVTALECSAPLAAIDAPSGTTMRTCREAGGGLEWNSYQVVSGGRTTVVEGLAAFDSALRLTLTSLAENRMVPGSVDIVTTGGTGSLALARASLGETDLLIGQGYRQNNAGDYSGAEEYFRPDLVAAAGTTQDPAAAVLAQHEVLVNRALQLSNLGRYLEAGRIFATARNMELRDPIQSRLLRNFEAIDAINRGNRALAREILARPVPELVDPVITADGSVEIDRALANGLNSGLSAGLTDAISQDTRLTTAERATIIDAQARQLVATADRLDGKPAEALGALSDARQRISAIREGRVLSTARLEAQLMSEMALSHEALGQNAQAEGLLREALALTALRYPESASVNAAKARLAAFLTRHGQPSQARTFYREIVSATAEDRGALVGLENQLVPYFDMLAAEAPTQPKAVADLFAAAQLVERPGAAQTLAQLSRRLEAGDGEASDLFRRETAVRREINRVDLARAQLAAGEAAPDAAALAELDARRARLEQSQVELLDRLSAYPAYRSLARESMSAEDLRALLGPDEAYLQLVEVGGAMYAVYLSPARASGWKVPASAAAIERLVDDLRESISVTVGGVVATYPFDVDTSRNLFDALIGPVAGDLAEVKHLIFEPDGALLELPVNLLVAEQTGVDAYHDRVAKGGDEYDFRGVGWLGRGRAISTALTPTSFRDARKAPASRAASFYLGLGQNEPVGPVTRASLVRSVDGSMDQDCAIPLAAWNRPISAEELVFASRELGTDRSELITGGAFTDTAIERRDDLDKFRILHFATHGIVTAPRPSCPVSPALLTSFGGDGSDGLLQFGDIFDLNLDADLVILSACNTASLAGLEATQAAGIEGGGGQALDGLVRAFIGAGGRQVIASHWPAPDEFGATRRLFETFFDAPQSLGTADALLAAQSKLMDDPDTSHPFYWSGFALIGDGKRPLFQTR